MTQPSRDIEIDLNLATDFSKKAAIQAVTAIKTLVDLFDQPRSHILYTLTLLEFSAHATILGGGALAAIIHEEETYHQARHPSRMISDFPKLAALMSYRKTHLLSKDAAVQIADTILWALAKFREIEGRDAIFTTQLRERML